MCFFITILSSFFIKLLIFYNSYNGVIPGVTINLDIYNLNIYNLNIYSPNTYNLPI